MERIILISFIHFLFLLNLTAQSNQLDIQLFSFEDGLSHRNVFDIQQDSLGLIWVATINGLNQFDGKEFINFSKNDTNHFIPAEYVSEIIKKPNGNFVLTSPNQLIIFNPLTRKYHSIKPDSSSVLFRKEFLPSIYYSNEDETWTNSFAQTTNLACIQRCSEDAFLEDLIVSSGKNIHQTTFQSGKYIYTYKKGSILKKNPTGRIVDKYRFPNDFQADLKLNPIIRMDVDQGIWVLFNKLGLYYKGINDEKFSPYEISDLVAGVSLYNDFLVDESKNIWISGMGQFWFFNHETNQLIDVDKNIPHKENYSINYRKIFQDKQGTIWLATNFGLVKIVKSNRLFTTYLNEKNQYCSSGICSIRGITGDDKGNIYFSYYNSIHRLNVPTGIVTPLFPRGNFFNAPFGLEYANDKLWTGNGLKVDWENQTVDTLFRETEKKSEGVVIVGSDNHIWFGNNNHIFVYNQKNNILDTFPTPFDGDVLISITYLYQSRIDENILWVGTKSHGVYKLDKKMESITPFANTSNFLPHNRVLAILEQNKNLWVGTSDGLVSIPEKQENYQIFNSGNGLPNNFINGMLSEGDSCLWLSTDNGLSRFDFKNQKMTNFFREDGLPSNEFNRISFYKSKTQIYFGGMKGIVAFSPKNKYQKALELQETKIVFTSFSKYDTGGDELITTSNLNENKIILTHRDKFPTFKFVLPDFRNSGKIKYSYILDGFDRDWSVPDHSNIAKYHNLPHGEYTFKVKASFVQGKWNEERLIIPIVVLEAYYKKWWFILLIVGAILGLTYAYIRYRFFQIKNRKLQLEKEVAVRTFELEEEKQKSEKLLLNILPLETARELMEFGRAKARQYDQVTVLFADFKGFTRIAEQVSPEELVDLIDLCFRNFDEIIGNYGLEKIKTMGDAYMCAGGITSADSTLDIMNIVKAALDMQVYLKALAFEQAEAELPFFEARIGIHTGPVVAGVVGFKKFAYDIWGDTVNIAARMETSGETGKVNVSAKTYSLIKDQVEATYRGEFEIKNRGMIEMYFVDGVTNDFSNSEESEVVM